MKSAPHKTWFGKTNKMTHKSYSWTNVAMRLMMDSADEWTVPHFTVNSPDTPLTFDISLQHISLGVIEVSLSAGRDGSKN